MRFVYFAVSAAALSSLLPVLPASAAQVKSFITYDTFVDSAGPTENYGGDPKVKAVSNGGSSMFPFDPATGKGSITHAFFKLPQSFWDAVDAYGTNPVDSAKVDYFAFNNSLSAADQHGNVELHPLTRSFVDGNGIQSTTTTAYVPPTQAGATWLTSDGTTPWTTAGGDYDATDVLASGNVSTIASKGSTPFEWDITALINNPATRTELRSYGAVLVVQNQFTFNNDDFLSMYSANYGTGDIHLPVAIVGVPEPMSVGAIAGAVGVFGLRRSRCAARA